ncbi:nodal-related 2 [Pholidichthys leucotaenia]
MRPLQLLGLALQLPLLAQLQTQSVNDTGIGAGQTAGTRHHLPQMERASVHFLPSYMMELYWNFRSNFTRIMDTVEQDAAEQADTVKSVAAERLTYGHGFGTLTFDLLSLVADDQIHGAELRVKLPQRHKDPNITLEVYHQHDETLEMVAMLNSSSVFKSVGECKVFNMTSQLMSWLKQKSTVRLPQNVLRRDQVNEKKRGPFLPGQPGYVAHMAKKQRVSHRALLVVFSKTGSGEKATSIANLLHTAEQSKFVSTAEIKKITKSNRDKRDHPGKIARVPPVPIGEKNATQCRKVDFIIDFDKIGWGSLIVAPKTYNAFRCEGSCSGPLGDPQKPTNHAYMQALLNHVQPDKVPLPSCAPSEMKSLSMLYFENQQMFLRHHKDMIVDECSCQ